MMKRVILLCVNVLICIHTTYAYNKEFSQDSIMAIVEAQSNPADKIQTIAECLEDCKFSNGEEIKELLSKGEEIASTADFQKELLQLIFLASKKYFLIGEIENSLTTLDRVQLLAEKFNDQEYLPKCDVFRGEILVGKGSKDEAMRLYRKGLKQYKSVNDLESMSYVFGKLGNIQRSNGQYEKALSLADSAIVLLKPDTTNSVLLNAYGLKGRSYRALGDNILAQEYFLKAKEIALLHNDNQAMGVALNNLGNIAQVLGELDKALSYYEESLSYKEKIGNLKGICIAILNIGGIQYDLHNHRSAITHFERANELADQLQNELLGTICYRKLGLSHLQLGETDIAIDYHNKGLARAIKGNNTKEIIGAYYALGEDHQVASNLDLSLINYFNALDIAEEIGSKPYESAILTGIALTYLQNEELPPSEKFTLSENFRGQDIEELLLRAKRLGTEMGNMENTKDALESLHTYYTSTKEYQKDNATLLEYLNLRDSIFSIEKTSALSEWEAKFNNAEQEKEIVKLEAENRIAVLKQNQFKYFLFGSLLFFLLAFAAGYYYLKQKNEKKESQQREMFRSRLSSDLHDDVGTILTGLAMQSELLTNFVDDKAKGNVENLAKMSRDAMTRMRDTVWAIDSRKDRIEDLKDRILDFAEDSFENTSFELQFEDNFTEKSKKIDPEIRQNIYLIFKEAISNILKYSKGDKVKVSLFDNLKNISLEVSDNGVNEPNSINTSGTGLSNMKLRVEKFDGKFSYNYHNGFKIKAEIPV